MSKSNIDRACSTCDSLLKSTKWDKDGGVNIECVGYATAEHPSCYIKKREEKKKNE